MRKWLIVVGCVCLVAGGVWLALRAQRPASPGSDVRAGRTAAAPPGRMYPRPGQQPASAGARSAGGGAQPVRVAPSPGKSLVPQFDPFLDQLAAAALAGNLEKAAAENGIKLRGEQVRVVIRPTIGGGEKVRAAVQALGGEIVRTIDRGAAEPTMVAWVPARSLRTLSENDAVRNLHRPVGIHANEAPEQPKPKGPGAPGPEAPPEPPAQ
jgi:hypothetical protein